MVDSENAHMLLAVTYIRPVLNYWTLAHVCLMNSLDTCRQSDGSFSGIGTSITHETNKQTKKLRKSMAGTNQDKADSVQCRKDLRWDGAAATDLKPSG